MKKLIKIASVILLISSLTSCATILGGKVTECQRTKPSSGAARKVRVGALVADIFFTGATGIIVDFATNAIYKPCK
jgi:hypothetical protein